MKTILYMAISIDGKITGDDDDTSWVEEQDVARMDELMVKCGVMVMGSNTYRSFGDELPTDSALQVVLTRNEQLLNTKIENVRFTNKPSKEVIKELADDGYKKVLFAGGGILNTVMINEGLIDEIRVIVKPIVLGKGKSLFNEVNEIAKFKCVSVEKLEDGSAELHFVKQ